MRGIVLFCAVLAISLGLMSELRAQCENGICRRPVARTVVRTRTAIGSIFVLRPAVRGRRGQ